MRKFLIAASAAALGLTVAAAASAEEAQRRGPRGGVEWLFQSDANGDGVLTRAEFDAGRAAHFARLDANGDGQVTREERRAQWQARRGEHAAEPRGERRDHFARLDANGDGAITREEFLAGPSGRFDRLDANNDGVIGADERPQPRERGARHHRGGQFGPDADRDGVLTSAEFTEAGAALFTRFDADGDGQITRAEAEAARPHRRGPAPAQ